MDAVKQQSTDKYVTFSKRERMNTKSFLMTVLILAIAIISQAQKTGSITDARDNSTYMTVQVGTQTWMAENLNFNTKNSWCYNDSITNCQTYGKLYSWPDAQKACLSGWHLPSDEEWTTLITYLGGECAAGGKLKTTFKWAVPNYGATDSVGFSGNSGGFRTEDGSFNYKGFIGYWWTTKEYDTYAYYFYLSNKSKCVFTTITWKQNGLSVRCVKDKPLNED